MKYIVREAEILLATPEGNTGVLKEQQPNIKEEKLPVFASKVEVRVRENISFSVFVEY